MHEMNIKYDVSPSWRPNVSFQNWLHIVQSVLSWNIWSSECQWDPELGYLDQRLEFYGNIVSSLVANTKISHRNI